jgi:hypothetical protein
MTSMSTSSIGGGDRGPEPVGLDAAMMVTAFAPEDANVRSSSSCSALNGAFTDAVEGRQDAHGGALVDHRHEQGGMRVGHPEAVGGDPQMPGDVVDALRASALEHESGGRAGDHR